MLRKIVLLLLFLPFVATAQIEQSLQLKIAILKSFSEKAEKGEELFWQTKGKITFSIVNYTDAQNPVFKDLFIRQYNEIMPVFLEMAKTQSETSTQTFVQLLIRHEEDYRKLLTNDQLILYRNKLTELETTNPKLSESYSSLYFSDALLKLYKSSF